jgi:Rrf2 family protein
MELDMKISTKGRYALRLMLDLALHNNGECVSIKEISERQEISDKYLEQIITVLNRAGFVRSVRGAQGGYMLSKEPKDYTVGNIIRLMEGNLAPVSCIEDEENKCERASSCVTVEIWEKINEAVNNVIDNITLADLVSRTCEKSGADYSI